MLRNFGNRCTEDVYQGSNSKYARRLPIHLHENAQDKLDMICAAKELDDLRVPPGNKLEPLKWKYKGMHSIRINNQWRIIFHWEGGNAYDVEIVDYHK